MLIDDNLVTESSDQKFLLISTFLSALDMAEQGDTAIGSGLQFLKWALCQKYRNR